MRKQHRERPSRPWRRSKGPRRARVPKSRAPRGLAWSRSDVMGTARTNVGVRGGSQAGNVRQFAGPSDRRTKDPAGSEIVINSRPCSAYSSGRWSVGTSGDAVRRQQCTGTRGRQRGRRAGEQKSGHGRINDHSGVGTLRRARW